MRISDSSQKAVPRLSQGQGAAGLSRTQLGDLLASCRFDFIGVARDVATALGQAANTLALELAARSGQPGNATGSIVDFGHKGSIVDFGDSKDDTQLA